MSDVASRLTAALADRYRIVRELGAGGMATVYLAEDLKHQRNVAVKVLHPDLAAALGGERFLTEIRTTANLQHPHILPLHDSGHANGALFYVMPFVDGESLRDRLRREKLLPIDDAIRIAREVADALAYAHERGVIHRDIKPENILLQGGHALVADFGIALAVQSAGGQRLTQTGLSLGTPAYMSPEQAMGERDLDARSDVYALGAVTYEMLTGDPPFTGSTVQAIVAKVLTERPAAIRTTRDTVPPDTEQAILRALAKLPADRFASASEFAGALGRPAAHGSMERAARTRTRVDWRLAAVAGVIVGAALGAAVTALISPRAVRGASSSAGAPLAQLTFNGRSGLPAISPNGDFVAYVDLRCERGESNPCVSSLIVQESGNATPVKVLTSVPFISAPRWTHDGAALVFGAQLDSLRVGVFIIPRLGGVARLLGPPGAFDTHPSADSVLLIASRGRDAKAVAYIIATGTGAVADSLAFPPGGFADVAWSPNGRHLVLTRYETAFVMIGRDGLVRDSLQFPTRGPVRWSPAGDAVIGFRMGAGREDDLVQIPVDRSGRFVDKPIVSIPKVQTLYRGNFDIARRSGRLVFATGNSTADIWTFDVADGARTARQRTRGTTWYGAPSISPDGKHVFYLRGDGLGDNLYTLAADATEDEALSAGRFAGLGGDVHVSADGRRVTAGHVTGKSRRISVIDVATRRATFVDTRYPGEAMPLGERGLLDRMYADVGIAVLDSVGGRWRELRAPDSLRVESVTPSPDGRTAAVLVRGDRAMMLGTTPLSSWDLRVLHRVEGVLFFSALSWSVDGGIYYARWLEGDDSPSLWRQPSTGGAPRRLTALPRVCATEAVTVAVAAATGACLAYDENRSDIWLASIPGVTR